MLLNRVLSKWFRSPLETTCDPALHLVHIGLDTSTFRFLFVHYMPYCLSFSVLPSIKVSRETHVPGLFWTKFLYFFRWNYFLKDRFCWFDWVKVELRLPGALLCGGHRPRPGWGRRSGGLLTHGIRVDQRSDSFLYHLNRHISSFP